jgi:iron complex outermembrane recepter protein
MFALICSFSMPYVHFFGGQKPCFSLTGFSLFVSFFFVLFPTLVHAQQDSATLNAVVIQSTRTGSNSPVPHTNLRADAIARLQQAQDVPFLLTSVPSLVETSDAGAGVGYTGLRIRGSDPTRVNVTINGVPLNDAESQGVFWVNMPDLAASASEIQVQRGVGTSTNGAGAFGASVNIDLSRVAQEPFLQLGNTVASFGTRRHNLRFGTGALADGRLSFTGRLSQVRSGGYVDRATARLQAMHLTASYITDRQSLQAHVLSGKEITYQAWNGLPAQYYDAGTPRTYNVSGTERTDQPHPDEVDNYTQRHHLLHYKYRASERLLVQLNGHYTRGYGYFEQYKAKQEVGDYGLQPYTIGDTSIAETDLIRRRWLDNHYYGLTWAIKYAAPKAKFTFGGAASQYRGQHFGEVIWAAVSTATLGHRYYDNTARKDDANTFVQIETDGNKRFSALLDLQLRYVGYQYLGFNNDAQRADQSADLLFFNPKMGAKYRIQQGWEAYAFTGIGHREPNRDDFTQSTPQSRPKAERLYNLETGVRAQRAQWSATVNLFGMYYRDQLVLSGRINDVGAYGRTNVPRSYRAGIELEAAAQPTGRFRMAANVALSTNKALDFVEYRDNWATWSQEVFTYTRTDLAFSPNTIARTEVGYAILPKGKKHALEATLSGKYVGRQFLDNTGNELAQLPAFSFFDLRLNHGCKLGAHTRLDVILAINNLFDARYASNGWAYRFVSAGYDPRPDDPYARNEQGDNYHQAGYFPQAGRNWMLSAILNW